MVEKSQTAVGITCFYIGVSEQVCVKICLIIGVDVVLIDYLDVGGGTHVGNAFGIILEEAYSFMSSNVLLNVP